MTNGSLQGIEMTPREFVAENFWGSVTLIKNTAYSCFLAKLVQLAKSA